MNQDAMIDKIAHRTGKSRAEIIQLLKPMSADSNIQKELKRQGYKK